MYRYDPEYLKEIELFDFPDDVKNAIMKRDDYKCVVCGRGIADGVELCIDHIKHQKIKVVTTPSIMDRLCVWNTRCHPCIICIDTAGEMLGVP